jgi:hypothetical protein
MVANAKIPTVTTYSAIYSYTEDGGNEYESYLSAKLHVVTPYANVLLLNVFLKTKHSEATRHFVIWF